MADYKMKVVKGSKNPETHQDMHVSIGLRSGVAWAKIKGTTGQAVGMTIDDLYEIAGLLDDALTEWEDRIANGDIYPPAES